MKNKLLIMFLTFLVMIGVTPLIFDKLMNAKFNKMLENVKKDGFEVIQIEDKSTYLQTDRIFKVVIPGQKIDNNGYIKDIVLKVETKFKNLPVTDVKFFGKVLKIDTADEKLDKNINTLIKDKINFLVITPNFKTYRYKIFDTDIGNDIHLVLKDVNGVFVYPNKNDLKIGSFIYKDKLTLEFKNIKSEYEKDGNAVKNKTSFNMYFGDKQKISLINFRSNGITYFGDKIKSHVKFSFDSLDIFKNLFVEDFKADFTLDKLDLKSLKELQNTKDKYNEKLTYKLFEKGLDINLKTKIKDIKTLNQELGFFDLDASMKFLPTKNLEQKLKNKDLSFLEFYMDLKTTPKISMLIMNLMPKSAFIFALAKKEKGIIELKLKLKNGEVEINGEKIKSN
ncbi:hypothetical protein JCM11957_00910 [Caminibacter profundus]